MMLNLKLQYSGYLMRRVDSLEKTLMLGGIGGGRKGDNRGWDVWMASLTRWTWVWVNSGSWWWTGRPGVLWFMGSQRVRHDWVTELNWTELNLPWLSNAEESEVEWFYEDLKDLLELTPPKDVLCTIGDWNAKLGSQETPGITGKFGLGIRSEARQKLIEFCQENALVIANSLFQHTREDSTRGHHQMVNTKIRLIILFAVRDGEALYSQQKQDQELTVAQIMNSLLPNSDKLKKVGKTTRPFRYDLN